MDRWAQSDMTSVSPGRDRGNDGGGHRKPCNSPLEVRQQVTRRHDDPDLVGLVHLDQVRNGRQQTEIDTGGTNNEDSTVTVGADQRGRHDLEQVAARRYGFDKLRQRDPRDRGIGDDLAGVAALLLELQYKSTYTFMEYMRIILQFEPLLILALIINPARSKYLAWITSLKTYNTKIAY